jgi:hypothetical protein
VSSTTLAKRSLLGYQKAKKLTTLTWEAPGLLTGLRFGGGALRGGGHSSRPGNTISRPNVVMKTRWLLFVSFAVLAVVLFAITEITISLLNPLRKPSDQIRANLLARSPLGTNEDEVRAFVEKERWLYLDRTSESYFMEFYRKQHNGVGSRAIDAQLGGYQGFPWWVSVRVLWVFNDEGELIEVEVHKVYDSP